MTRKSQALPPLKACDYPGCGRLFLRKTKRSKCDEHRRPVDIRGANPYRFDCLECGAEFTAKHPAKLWCSRACKQRVLGRQVVRMHRCDNCGVEFGLRRSQANKGNGTAVHFCSEECLNDHRSAVVLGHYASGRMVNGFAEYNRRRREAV